MTSAASRPRRLVGRATFSIRGRLVALFVVLALCTTTVVLFGMQRVLHDGWQGWAKALVADYADRLADEIGTPPDLARAQALVQRLPITVRIDGPLLHYESHPRRRAADADDAEEWRAPGWGVTRRTADGHRIRFGLAAPPEPVRPRLVGAAMLATLLLLTALAYAAVHRLLAPLQAIGAGVEAYGRGEFQQPIPVRRRDELGLLTERINGMAGNLSGMLQAQRALLLAISHELRSPLTRARVNAELVDDGPARSALLRDLGEMRELISSLLESERLARGPAALQAEPTDLAALVHEVVAARAEGPAPTLQIEPGLAPVLADPTRLRLLLRNLLENASRHGAGSAVEVVLRTGTEGPAPQVVLGVRDHGPGVAPDQLPLLAQAFYRPDSARTRASGGTGLGLYLCRLVAQAHGGTLCIRNAEPGLEVSALLPLVPAPPAAASAAAAARSSPR